MKNNPKILVIGDMMIDHYLWGKTDRISPEAPVQIVDISHQDELLGGAGNVINNLRAFGCDVATISVVGDDTVAQTIKNKLDDIAVKHILIKQKNRTTSKKSRLIASHQQVVRYDEESKDDISNKTADKILSEFKHILKNYDIVLLSDYGKGVLTDNLTKDIITYSNKIGKKVLVDPKGDDFSKYSGAYLLTPNRQEAVKATNIEIKDDISLKKSLTYLMNIVKVPLITLSEDGIAVLLDKDEVYSSPTVAREVYDVTGAGDTVLASLGYCLAKDMDIKASLQFANLAASVVVSKIGSATATIDEIERYKDTINQNSIDSHIKTTQEIKEITKNYKNKNKKIVFTNGCFDILHKGHVSYLHTAKSFGDILIVGLNSDKSVKKLKGENRPINTQDDRAYILSALKSVDMVVLFDEDTPYELIKCIKPDVLVKGGDYKGKDVVGSDIAGSLKLVDFVDGKSTTKIIQKIEQIDKDKD